MQTRNLDLSNPLLGDLLDLVGAITLVMNREGRILKFNAAAEKLTGYKADEVIGKIFWDMFLPKEETEIAAANWKILLNGEYPNKHENKLITRSGIKRLVSWSNTAVLDECGSVKFVVSAGIDITENSLAKQALRSSQIAQAERQRFYEVLETLPVYVVLLRPDYYMPFANRVFRENFAYSSEKKCYEFLFNRDKPCDDCQTYTVLKTNKSHHWEWTGPNNRNYEVFDFPFKDTDDSQLILEMGIDVTERVKAEAILEQHSRKVEELVTERTNQLELANTLLMSEIEERTRIEANQRIAAEVLSVLNANSGDLKPAIRKILGIMKQYTDFDAVGLRLHSGDDYPYFEQNGFSEEFVEQENFLCPRHGDNVAMRDEQGRVLLECTCGLVLSGRTDPTKPFFTEAGSFWTNRSSELLNIPVEADPRLNPRNTCIYTGYESIALIPLRSGNEIIGMLQLNAKKAGCFTREQISFYESVCDNIGLALRRKQAEMELQASKDKLLAQTQELESIIGVVSHDLRAPLVNVRGFSGFIKQDVQTIKELLSRIDVPGAVSQDFNSVLDESMPEAVGFIETSAGVMDTLVKSLVQVARAGLAVLNPEWLDMNSIMKTVLANLDIKFKRSGAKVCVDNLPSCWGDKTQITQVFTNLLDNAVKYLDPDVPGHIHVSGQVQKDKVVYCVKDNGVGIPVEDQGKIFEIFTRLASKAHAGGEGMGLTMVQRMVDRNNGKIWVISEKGKGSSFFVSFPLQG